MSNFFFSPDVLKHQEYQYIHIYIYIGYIPYKTFDQNDLVNLYLVWLRLVPWLVKVSALVG